MRKLVIAIDCDDVLVDSAPVIIEGYNIKYQANLELNAYYSIGSDKWDIDDVEVAIRRIDTLLRDDHVIDELKPTKEVIQAITKLAQHHELHLVTGRQTYLKQVTKRLVDTYFPGCFQTIEHTNYIAASDSTEINRTKGDVCAAVGADILVDDHIVHIEDVLKAGVKQTIVFGNYPWNRQRLEMKNACHCSDWRCVLQEIERIAYE